MAIFQFRSIINLEKGSFKVIIFVIVQGCQQILKYFFKVISGFLTQFDPNYKGFLNIFQGPDALYYNAEIGKNMKIAKYIKHSF